MGAPNLFDYAKRLGIEPKQEETQSSSYALDYINEGIAGYKQYLADSEQERALVAEADKIANKPKWWQFKKLEEQGYNWWEGIADSFSSGYEKDENGNYKFTGLEKYQNAATANKLRHERPNNTWSQQELAEFGHKYVSNRDDAYAYAKQINDKYAREGRERQASESLSEFAEKHPAIASAGSIGLKIAGGLSDLTRNTMQYLGGGEIYEKDKVGLSDYGNAVQSTITEKLNEKGTINEGVPVFGGKGLGDLYGLGMSIAQTAALAPTGSAGTLIAYFGTSASEAMSDALARGATSDQAYRFGLISGAAEAIPEMIQMDKLIGLASKEAVQSLFKSVLKMAGSEAGEELTTSIINEIADRWIMSDKSNFQMRVNSLIAQGYSPELAKKKAWAETFEGFAYDAITGAVSGGIMGAGAIGVGNVTGRLNTDANTQAKENLSPKTAELIEEGKKYESTKKRAEALEKKVSEGKELTGYELRMYSNQLSEAARTADVETTRKAIVDKMKAEGIEEGKAKRLGEIALNKAIGNEISQVQEVMLRRNEGAMKVYNQISEKVMDSGYGDSQWAEETAIRRLRAENKALNEARQAEANGTTVQQLQEQKAKQQRLEALKRDVAKKYGTKNYKISTESLDKVLGENNGRIIYKTSKDSMLDVSELKTNLSAKDIIELGNIEAIANALGKKIKVYATTEQKYDERAFVDKSGEKITANGFFKTSTGEIGIDLRAGMNGEGVMLYTTSHELVHEIKRVSEETFDALEKLVTKALVSGGYSIETLIEDQKNKLIAEGKDPNSMSAEEFEALAREEMVADACMKFLASKNAIAEIKALQTENKGLWNALKKFFSKLFIRLNDRYKEVDPYSVEGLALADMRDNVVKPIRDIFFEGAKKIAEHNKTETKTETTVESNTVSTASIKGNTDGAVTKSEAAETIVKTAKNDGVMLSTRTELQAFPKQTVNLSTGSLVMLHDIEGLAPTKIAGLTGKSVNGYSGRAVREYEMKNNGYSASQIKNVNEFMDTMAKFMDDAGVTYQFIGLTDVKNAKLHYRYNSDGSIKSIVLSAMVKNGDYPVNFDLSSICKKREAMSTLMDKLAKRGSIDNGTVDLTPASIFKINTALKDAGYETACLGCFVESKRYNSLQWAKSFCNKWNAAVKKANPNATYFDYGNASFKEESFTLDQAAKVEEAANKYITTAKTERMANALEKYKERERQGLPLVVRKSKGKELYDFSAAAKDRLMSSDTISDELKEKYINCDTRTLTMSDVEFLLENGILPGASLSNKQSVTELVKSGEAYQHLLRPSDLLTARGISKLEALPNFHGVLYGHYGSGTPKLIQGFTPYNSEIALLPSRKNANQTISEYLYSIAGVRMQSFSDFQVQNVYDYLQMVADLTARKLPAHAYTKEISFAKLLGMTGVKVNLSVMFDIDPTVDKAHAGLTKYNPLIHKGEYAKIVLEDKQGKWVYNIGDYQTQRLYAEAFPKEARRFLQSIGFADAVKLQTSEGYSANCGIIGVGYSDLGIFAMLDDNRIRYIIPYHASSLPADVKVATNIEHGTDYTPYQNNMKIDSIVDKNGAKVEWSIKDAYKRLKNGQAVVNELNENVRKYGWVVTTKKAQTGHGTYGLYEDLMETNDPRKTAANFMDWCAGNGTLPIFYQFASHNNYYKMIYDFNVYDCVTEEYAPQQAVTNTYPTMVDGSVKPANVVDGGFNTEYFEQTIDKQMSFMNEYNRNLDSDLDKLADNMEKGNYSLEEKAISKGKIAIETTNKSPTKSADIRYSTRNYSEGLSAEDKAVADKVIKNLKQQKMASEYGVRNYATYTDNRMNYEIQYSSAQGDPDYAHAYITWVNPTDFVYATTSMESVRERLKEEAGKLDIDRLREQKQAIYLRVDFETGQIVGHEGRHRMLALQDAGIDRVAVIIEAKNDEYWHTKPIDIMHLKGQRFEERRTGTDFYIHDLLPLSERYAGVASEIFAHDSKNGVRFSSRYTDYNKPITIEDIETLRSIGRKSVNNFDSEEIKKAQKWAYKFYKELGVKSPFFRAWFGDWREYQEKIDVTVAEIPVYIATNEARKENRGLIKNEDTQWNIRISREGETNTISHSGEDRLSEYGLAGIKGLLTNAVLLDSEVHEHHKNNAKNDLISFDHKLYALGMDNKGTTALYKITVEEFYQSKTEPGNKRFHNLRYIQKIADNVGGRTFEKSRSGGSTNDTSAKYSVADLFALVKQYDKEFKPKSVNPLLLDKNKQPRVFYHGTPNGNFTEFSYDDVGKVGGAQHGYGFYFAESEKEAKLYTQGKGQVISAYLKITNPIYATKKDLSENVNKIFERLPGYAKTNLVEKYGDLSSAEKHFAKYDNGTMLSILGKQTGMHPEVFNNLLGNLGYDGIVYEEKGYEREFVVFKPEQIKSATDNIGTFDSREKDIRYSSRTKASAPYVSPTATSIVTDIDSGYDYTGKDKFMSGVIATQIAFTNAQAGIESIAKKYGVKNIESLVQAARTASHQAEEMISGNQYRIGSDTKTYLGEGLQKIFSTIDEKGDEVKQAFFDYLFHYHNADRMSLEQRSIEWNEENKKEHQAKMRRFTELQKEQTALFKEKAGLTRKQSDSARRQEINQRLTEIKREIATVTKLIKKLQKEIDSFVPLKNKAVIGLNRAEIMAKKEELSKQIDELIARKKSLGRSKQNAAEVTKISLKIGELIAERDSLTAEVTADKSKEIIAEYEKNYDYFKEVAEKIWRYNRNLNQYRVDTGLINQEQYDYLEKLYPHYVPSYRADVSTGIAAVKGKNNLAITQSIKAATGSTKDLLNPIVIMARQTMETVRAGRINQIAEAIYNGAGQDKTYIAEVSRKKVKQSEVVDIDPTELRPKANQVTFFRNGERITLQVSSEIFAGFDAFAPAFDIKNPLVKVVSGGTNLFKKLVTSANPVFLIRNAIRDVQDAGINTKYGKEFVSSYIEAIKQISSDGELWKLYKAMGGSNASYFDFDKGFLAEQNKRGFSKKIKDEDAGKLKSAWQTAQSFVQIMENANAFVEALPRLAEFISSIKAGNTAEQAMLDAADVTTNFARTGKITRALNSTVIPFLNPAIQGASKAVRNVASIRSVREAAILAAKATLLGIAPFLLNALLYRDDEDYEELRESDKENNYLIKIGDVFLKIPRGRMASVLAGATNRTTKEFLTDEDVDWVDYVKNVSTQMNPLENMSRTIFSPFLDVANNVTWYGSAIEGREFENKAPKDRFDEGTSSIAIAMGKVLNYSPKKIHYLIDQYSGVIGDFILPATTKKAERGFLSGNFTIDPVTSNKLSDDFYDMYYDAQYAKSADPDDKVAEYQVKHLNRVKSSISELFKAKDEIQNSNKSDKEKRAETEAIQILINEAYKTALTDYELITNAIKTTSGVDDKYRYTEVLRLVYGAKTALKEYDDDVYELSTVTKKAGVSYDVFYKYYFSIKDIKSDKDKHGNTIPGSKKKKVIEKIESLNLSADRKRLLIAMSGYSLDSEAEKQRLIKYINSLKISAKEKEILAEKCGLSYKNGKITP